MKLLVVLAILIIVLLNLLCGIITLEKCYEFDNPIYKPLFILFWPIVWLVVAFWALFGNWIEDVIYYYEEKKERKND